MCSHVRKKCLPVVEGYSRLKNEKMKKWRCSEKKTIHKVSAPEVVAEDAVGKVSRKPPPYVWQCA